MTVTVASFRDDYPEFADASIYTDASITRWIALSALFVNPTRWGQATDYGTELWVAHNVAISGDKLTNNNPLDVGAPTTEQHVGEVGFSTNPALLFQGLDGIGFYARTSYGISFFQLAKMFGSGGLQL